MVLPAWTRDEEEFIVDDPRVIHLACLATGVYDKPFWYSGEIPPDVWSVVEADIDGQVAEWIDAGASWSDILAAAGERS